MVKRIFLFMLTNVAVVVTISIILSLLGVRPGDGLVPMAIFCFVWGMGGAFISLAISRWMAKRAMGVKLVDGNTGNPDADWLSRTVERLAQQAQLPMPEVGIYRVAGGERLRHRPLEEAEPGGGVHRHPALHEAERAGSGAGARGIAHRKR